MEMGGFD